MSKKIKKQSLLGKTPKQKKPIRPTTARATSNSAPVTPATPNNVRLENKKNPTKWYALALIILILLITPKPTLITYEKLGMVTSSVYWPGLFGYGATLFDSSLEPIADLNRGTLYLCQDLLQPTTCHKYNITQQHGFFPALKKLALD